MDFNDVRVGDVWAHGPGSILVTFIDEHEFHAIHHDGSIATWWKTEDIFFDHYKLISRNKTVTVSVS